MQLVNEKQSPDPSSPTTTTTNWENKPPTGAFDLQKYGHLILGQQNQTWKAGVLGALNFAAQVIAVRLILLIAVLGAILLSWAALSDPQLLRVAALGVYALLVVLPVVWLAASGRG